MSKLERIICCTLEVGSECVSWIELSHRIMFSIRCWYGGDELSCCYQIRLEVLLCLSNKATHHEGIQGAWR